MRLRNCDVLERLSRIEMAHQNSITRCASRLNAAVTGFSVDMENDEKWKELTEAQTALKAAKTELRKFKYAAFTMTDENGEIRR